MSRASCPFLARTSRRGPRSARPGTQPATGLRRDPLSPRNTQTAAEWGHLDPAAGSRDCDATDPARARRPRRGGGAGARSCGVRNRDPAWGPRIRPCHGGAYPAPGGALASPEPEEVEALPCLTPVERSQSRRQALDGQFAPECPGWKATPRSASRAPGAARLPCGARRALRGGGERPCSRTAPGHWWLFEAAVLRRCIQVSPALPRLAVPPSRAVKETLGRLTERTTFAMGAFSQR